MTRSEIISELKGYDQEKWMVWIEDILYYGMALPFDKITPEGDVLIDLSDLLHEFGIAPSAYETALVAVLNKLSKKVKSEQKLIRILNVLVAIVSPYSKPLLKRLLFDKAFDHQSFEGDSVKSKIFQAMVRLEYSTTELHDLIKYFRNASPRVFEHDIAMLGNYLRFIYLHFPEEYFFECMTELINKLEGHFSSKDLPSVVTVIDDKIREFYFERIHIFYHYFYHWLVDSFNLYQRNEIFDGVLKQAMVSLNKRYPKFSAQEHTKSVKIVAEAVVNCLNLILDKSYFSTMNAHALESLAAFLNHHRGEALLETIVSSNVAIIWDSFDSYDNSTYPAIQNTYFLFRGKPLGPYEKFSNLIAMLSQAEGLSRLGSRTEKRADAVKLLTSLL